MPDTNLSTFRFDFGVTDNVDLSQVIRGARQVGKTWLMKEFGITNYEKYAYINFDNNERMKSLFSGNLDIERIITALQIETGVKIEAQSTLIIFDEVQEVPSALIVLQVPNIA